jgi:hypothetical protein
MMMKRREVKLTKIHLESFLDLLMQIYDEGGDYIDIVAFPGGEQDVIKIVVQREYMNTEDREATEDLSEEDFNNLIL